jgi:hypothetical protein
MTSFYEFRDRRRGVSEPEATALAWAAIDGLGVRGNVTGLIGIRLSTLKEFCDFWGFDPEDRRDQWYARFQLRDDEEGPTHPDTVLITVDDRTGEAEVHYQM